MDFVKKNWANILLSLLTLAGAIFAIVHLVALSNVLGTGTNSFRMMSAAIGFLIFFAGLYVYFMCKMFPVSKKVISAILMLTGLVASIFLIIYLAEIINVTNAWATGMRHERNAQIMSALIYLFAFGLLPLVAGLKMICVAYCKEEDRKAGKR